MFHSVPELACVDFSHSLWYIAAQVGEMKVNGVGQTRFINRNGCYGILWIA